MNFQLQFGNNLSVQKIPCRATGKRNGKKRDAQIQFGPCEAPVLFSHSKCAMNGADEHPIFFEYLHLLFSSITSAYLVSFNVTFYLFIGSTNQTRSSIVKTTLLVGHNSLNYLQQKIQFFIFCYLSAINCILILFNQCSRVLDECNLISWYTI